MPEEISPAPPPNVATLVPWALLALAVILIDQWTKGLVRQHFAEQAELPVTSFFSLVLIYNQGAAFSFLAGEGGWQRGLFSAIAVVAAVVIVRLAIRHRGQALFCAGLALILGGALGNLYDRIALGKVVDFLLFHYAAWSFPAFNAADSAITAGAALLILDALRAPRATVGDGEKEGAA